MSALATARGKSAQAANKVTPYAHTAKESAVHYAEEARDWAAPHVSSAVEAAKERASRTRDDLTPKVAAGLAAVAAATEPAVSEARRRGAPALAALRGQEVVVVQERRGGVFRKLLLLVGLAGLAAAGYAAWQKSQSGGLQPSPWTPASSSPSSTSPAAAGVPSTLNTEVTRNDVAGPPTTDTGGASPDEAIADEAASKSDEPLPPTTPQAPPAGPDGTTRPS